MATYSIKWLRNFFGTKFFPITHITAVRDNNNVNLETLLNNKADEATTLAGYGITDAYTKTESNDRYYALLGGTALTGTSSSHYDLNTLTTAGSYYCDSNTTAGYIDNKPSNDNTSFRVWVSIPRGTNTVSLRQRFQFYNTVKIYERLRLTGSGSWGSWYLVQDDLNTYALSANVYTKADVYTKTDSNSRFYALSGVTYTSGSSIDVTTLDAGTYYISSVDRLIDPPTESYNGLSTYFWVLKPNDRHTIIRLQISDSPNIWEKYYMASSGWSNWVLVQDDLSKYALSAGSSSDARLKDKVDDINLNVEDIAKAPNLTFKWKNGKDNNLHGGTYAQYWENITPYYVHGSDSKTLEYGNLALTCSIELAKEMTKLKEENVQLKKELEDIKETLNKLNK